MANIVSKEIKEHPKRSTLTLVLISTLLVAFIGALMQYNWISMLFIFIIAILICVPAIIARLYKVDVPGKLEVLAVIFIYATLFLGEIRNYYDLYWWWDVLLHISSGVAFGIVGFIILYMLHKSEKVETSPKIVALFSFSFALAVGALWEIVEFTMDMTLGTPMQIGTFFWTGLSGGLLDTMKDLIDDSIGAIFSAVMGYLYLKRNSGIIVKTMIKELKKDNPRLFKKKRYN